MQLGKFLEKFGLASSLTFCWNVCVPHNAELGGETAHVPHNAELWGREKLNYFLQTQTATQPFCNAVDVWKQWLSESQIDLQMSNFKRETSDCRPQKQTSDHHRSWTFIEWNIWEFNWNVLGVPLSNQENCNLIKSRRLFTWKRNKNRKRFGLQL